MCAEIATPKVPLLKVHSQETWGFQMEGHQAKQFKANNWRHFI